jgi:glycosyltransferase involved in cell wall biosynthesis
LLEAYARIERRYPQFELVMAGAGDEEAELRRAAAELGIGERVRFPGYLLGLEKARALLEARIYVLASYHFEGLPVALMEAMGAGNAVITTRAGGIPDVFEDPDNGILLDEVTVDAIAAALERLLSDDAYCAELAERNVAKAWAFYEADIVTKRIEAAYARAAAAPRT